MILKSYDERVYLNDAEQIASLENFSEKFSYLFNQEKDTYRIALQQYDIFIGKVAKLLKELGYGSALECANMIEYLIRNGYVSINCLLEDKIIPSCDEINHRLGTTIVRGGGCCRNYSAFVKDVFRKLELPADVIGCYVGKPIIDLDKRTNHVINLVIYENNIYGIDTTNGSRLYKFDTPFVLTSIDPEKTHLLYKPYDKILFGERDIEQIQRTAKNLTSFLNRRTISQEEYEKYIVRYVENKMTSHRNDLIAFHNRTQKIKQKIVHEINFRQS